MSTEVAGEQAQRTGAGAAHQAAKSSEELKRSGMRKLSSDHSSSSRFCSGVPAARGAGGGGREHDANDRHDRHHGCFSAMRSKLEPAKMGACTREQQAVRCAVLPQLGVELAAGVLEAVPFVDDNVAPGHVGQARPACKWQGGRWVSVPHIQP